MQEPGGYSPWGRTELDAAERALALAGRLGSRVVVGVKCRLGLLGLNPQRLSRWRDRCPPRNWIGWRGLGSGRSPSQWDWVRDRAVGLLCAGQPLHLQQNCSGVAGR